MFCIALASYAQETKLSFRARSLVDFGVSGYELERNTRAMYSLEDLRLGFKAAHGNVDFKVDIGFGGEKVAVKDITFNYYTKNSFITIGNTYSSHSMEMLISTLDMYFHQPSTSSAAFGEGRKLGASYNLHKDKVYFASGAYTDNDINVKSEQRSDAFMFTTRLLSRNNLGENKFFHIGGAVAHITPDSKKEGVAPSMSVASRGITGLFKENIIEANLEDVGSQTKAIAEVLVLMPKWRLQSEYHFNWIETKEQMYKPLGGYVQASYLLIGRGFGYDSMYAIAARPKSTRALVLNLRYDNTNLNDYSMGIYGGEQQDFSVGLNYYIDRHFAIKLNCGYVDVGKHCSDFYRKDMVMGQLRLQYTL